MGFPVSSNGSSTIINYSRANAVLGQMSNIGHIAGLLVITAVFAAAPRTSLATPSANESLPAATQLLESANHELSSGHLTTEDRARVLVRRGLAHEMLGERADALSDFGEAISASVLASEEQACALYNRGVTLDELGRTDDAVADYSAALQLLPMFPAALNNRGNALRRLGRLDEARRDYEASMSAGNPHREYPEFGMGQIAEALGQPNAAAEYYRSALAANPGFTLAEARLVAMDVGGTPVATVAPRRPGHHPRARSRAAAHPVAGSTDLVLKPTISDLPASAGRSIQLGAYRSQAEASDAWDHAQKRTGVLLTGLTPSIVAVDLPAKGRYYRLRVGQLDAGQAEHLCASLRAMGTVCILPPD